MHVKSQLVGSYLDGKCRRKWGGGMLPCNCSAKTWQKIPQDYWLDLLLRVMPLLYSQPSISHAFNSFLSGLWTGCLSMLKVSNFQLIKLWYIYRCRVCPWSCITCRFPCKIRLNITVSYERKKEWKSQHQSSIRKLTSMVLLYMISYLAKEKQKTNID